MKAAETPRPEQQQMRPQEIKEVLSCICGGTKHFTLAITGGGSQAIGELLRHGGGSAVLLEAVVPYDSRALEKFIRKRPEKAASESTARAMAMMAYLNSLELIGKGNSNSKKEVTNAHNWNEDIIGVGATCKLTRGKTERDGRAHTIHVAVQSFNRTTSCELILSPHIRRSREEEEYIASKVILNMLALENGSRLSIPELQTLPEPEKLNYTTTIVPGKIAKMLREQNSELRPKPRERSCFRISLQKFRKPDSCHDFNKFHKSDDTGVFLNKDNGPGPYFYEMSDSDHPFDENNADILCQNPLIIFPGSFDPCHKNHLQMAHKAAERYGGQVHFELSITNVDKPPMDFISLEERIKSIRQLHKPYIGDVFITAAPLFYQKASLFREAHFIVGADTINRLFKIRYYRDENDLELLVQHLRDRHIRFIVFKRKGIELDIAPELLDMCDIISSEEYTDDGTCSSDIRKNTRILF